MTETGDIIVKPRSALPGPRAQWPIRSIALFGSRERDDATLDSDPRVLAEFARPVALSSLYLALEDKARDRRRIALDDYRADEKTRYAVMLCYEILGEVDQHPLIHVVQIPGVILEIRMIPLHFSGLQIDRDRVWSRRQPYGASAIPAGRRESFAP